jgi:hypothetical protein
MMMAEALVPVICDFLPLSLQRNSNSDCKIPDDIRKLYAMSVESPIWKGRFTYLIFGIAKDR